MSLCRWPIMNTHVCRWCCRSRHVVGALRGARFHCRNETCLFLRPGGGHFQHLSAHFIVSSRLCVQHKRKYVRAIRTLKIVVRLYHAGFPITVLLMAKTVRGRVAGKCTRRIIPTRENCGKRTMVWFPRYGRLSARAVFVTGCFNLFQIFSLLRLKE